MSADLSIDIETLSLSPTAACVQIGVVAFDAFEPQPMDKLMVEINLQEVLDRFTVDAGTLVWWMNQSDAARRRVFGEIGDPPKQGLRQALNTLTDFVRLYDPKRVWFLHPEFDGGVIKNLYHAFHEEPPWNYRSPRDVATIKDVARHLCGEIAFPVFQGVQHDAVDDAVFQAETVMACYRHLERRA